MNETTANTQITTTFSGLKEEEEEETAVNQVQQDPQSHHCIVDHNLVLENHIENIEVMEDHIQNRALNHQRSLLDTFTAFFSSSKVSHKNAKGTPQSNAQQESENIVVSSKVKAKKKTSFRIVTDSVKNKVLPDTDFDKLAKALAEQLKPTESLDEFME